MEQDCEELDGFDMQVEQPMEAMQLYVLPMHLAEEEVVGEPDIGIVE
jgi:hypothetical protein